MDFVRFNKGFEAPRDQPRKHPKLPYIIVDNKPVAHSHFIIQYLIKNGKMRDLDAGLTPVQRAESCAWLDSIRISGGLPRVEERSCWESSLVRFKLDAGFPSYWKDSPEEPRHTRCWPPFTPRSGRTDRRIYRLSRRTAAFIHLCRRGILSRIRTHHHRLYPLRISRARPLDEE
jgi:hypothetical protein